jgi:4-aminobutyrate aminotransferase-like enzyme/aminoglycoside phosphotransferase (APT) family kinase protein
MEHDLAAIAERLFGLVADVRPLPGEVDQIARLDTADDTYALRLSPPGTDRAVLEFHAGVLENLAGTQEFRTPQPVPALDGALIVGLPDGRLARVLTWVPGEAFARLGRPAGMAGSIGRTAARVVTALAGLEHPAASRELLWSPYELSRTISSHAGAIAEPRRRRIVERAAARLIAADIARLPAQVIHNDLNDENLLCADGKVVGVIDVGDTVMGPRIAEVAVASAYVMLGQDDPVTVGADVVRAFSEIVPVTAAEAAVVLDLVMARLAASVSLSAHRGGSNPHHTISEVAAWDLLERLDAADLNVIGAELAEAAGHQPSDHVSSNLLAARKRRLGPSLSLSYDVPLEITRGSGAYVFDQRGRRYVDAVNNVAHVGHSHPRVSAAAAGQMAVLNTNTRYLHPEIVRYADRLAELLPDPLEVVFLVNSGSEANELAIRLIRAATGAHDMVCLDHGYHGNTSTLVDVSPYKFDGPGGSGQPDWVAVLPAPDPYRVEEFRGPEAGARYGIAAAEVLAARARPIAGLIAEALPGCAGQVVPAPGVLGAAYDSVRDRGGLVIADEVQTGFGRVGAAFWAFELHGVVPDVVTLGKPIGNGHPLGAVVTTRKIAAAFDAGMEYFNTFGGNPVSAAVGNAVLDVIMDEGLQQNALRVGEVLMAGLRDAVPACSSASRWSTRRPDGPPPRSRTTSSRRRKPVACC